MQFGRLAFAALVLAALAAVGWLALRHETPGLAALDTPVRTEATRKEATAAALEAQTTSAARSEAANQPESSARSASAPASNASSSAESQDTTGLLVRVLTPASKPLPGASVSFESTGRSTQLHIGEVTTDSSGCARIHGDDADKVNLRASDPSGRLGPCYAFEEALGSGALDMQLEATTSRTLVVVDPNGAPVETFAWRMLDEAQYRSHHSGLAPLDENGLHYHPDSAGGPDWKFAPSSHEHQSHPGGRVELRTGSLDFVVQVDAVDFAPAEAGPLRAVDAPEEIRLVLQRTPGIRGRVVYDGKGVADAWVKLLDPHRGERPQLVNGFPSRIEPFTRSEARTEADGSFVLRLRTSGTFLLQAGASGLGTSETEPRRYSALEGAERIELVLVPEGAIEGRLLFPADERSRSRIVGASCGDGHARSTRTDEDGRFQFEHLTPGTWLLRPLERVILPDRIDSVTRPPDLVDDLPATCVVAPGQTARPVIDLREKALLLGEIRLEGWKGAICTGQLEPCGAEFSTRISTGSVTPEFLRLSVDQPGSYVLTATLRTKQVQPGLEFKERLRLAVGENRWKFASSVGALTLVNMQVRKNRALLKCRLSETAYATLGVDLEPSQELPLTGLPVGTWKPLRWEHGDLVEDAGIEIVAGASARLEWK